MGGGLSQLASERDISIVELENSDSLTIPGSFSKRTSSLANNIQHGNDINNDANITLPDWSNEQQDGEPNNDIVLPITQPGDGEAAPPGDSSLAEGHPLLPRQTLTRRAVLARKPVGMNDADAEYWKGLSSTPLPLWDDEEFYFWSEFSDSGDTFAWVNPLKIYGATKPYTWQVATISSIKFAEVIANRPKPVHILYESSQIDNLPPDSLMTLAEIGLITSRSSKVPRIYRWDVDTFDQRINGGSSPVDNVIWKAGDAQMYKELTDIRVSPRPRDEEAIYSSIDETLGNRGVAGKPAVPLPDNQS